MRCYNLVDEKWVPVRKLDGTHCRIGLRDLFRTAKEIRHIEDPSPLVVGSLYRLLLAILYRSLQGPNDFQQSVSLYREGLPGTKIDSYLDAWFDRFWLIDDTHPFYQLPGFEPKVKKEKQEWRAWTVIAAEHNADNAKVLFDHCDVTNAGAIPLENAACWLVACQAFVLGGGNSELGYTKNAPSATGAICIQLLSTLHDSLIANLVPQNEEFFAADQPVWEQELPSAKRIKKGVTRAPNGYAELYTWLSRAVRLNYQAGADGIREIAIAAGCEANMKDFIDPMMAYRVDEKRGRLGKRLSSKGLWREFDSLLPAQESRSQQAPLVVQHAIRVLGKVRGNEMGTVWVLGQLNDKARIDAWRMERFHLPAVLKDKEYIAGDIHPLLEEAEKTHKALTRSASKFISSSTSADKAKNIPFATMSVDYWSILEPKFHYVLTTYREEADYEDIYKNWLLSVRDALVESWAHFKATLNYGQAQTLRAVVETETIINKERGRIDKMIDEITNNQEVTQ